MQSFYTTSFFSTVYADEDGQACNLIIGSLQFASVCDRSLKELCPDIKLEIEISHAYVPD